MCDLHQSGPVHGQQGWSGFRRSKGSAFTYSANLVTKVKFLKVWQMGALALTDDGRIQRCWDSVGRHRWFLTDPHA